MSKLKLMHSRSDVDAFHREMTKAGRTVGFVPTMGALHVGHGELIARSAAENDETVVSIFVNPKQFGPSEDFSKYPRTLDSDTLLAESFGATAIFAPSVADMYPKGFLSSVKVHELDKVLCGAFREGHFDGVCTVVLLLLNLIRAQKAYFGMKDFQQLSIIKRMCADLGHTTAIVEVPTVRESDGLALSSRNKYLDAAGRIQAKAVPSCLARAAELFLRGETSANVLLEASLSVLKEHKLMPQYLELRNADHIVEVVPQVSKRGLLAVAQFIETPTSPCRLIDNVVLSTEPFYKRILEDLISKTKVN